MRVLRTTALALTGAAILFGVSGVSAQEEEEATGIVAYRHGVMGSFGAEMGALKVLLVEGEGPMEMAKVHAQYMVDSAPHIVAMFPEGSDGTGSKAMPAVWQDQAGFEEAATNFEEKAQAFLAALDGGDQQAAVQAYAALGKQGCGNCHDDYREKDED